MGEFRRAGDGIPTMAPPGVTPAQSSNGQSDPSDGTVPIERIQRVLRTRRHEPAGCWAPIGDALVSTNRRTQNSRENTEVRRGFHQMDAVIRRINRQSLRRWRPSGPVAARHGTNQRHRGTPGSGSHPPAPPGGADRGRPRSPGDDGGSGSGRRLVRRSGGWRRPPSRPDHPSPPPWPESRPATDHGAPCVHHVGGGGSRPVDAVCRSSRQTSAALLAARRDDGPAGAGLHPLPETVLPGSTPGVGLVRTLHERSPAGINGRRQEGERPNAVENDGIDSAVDRTPDRWIRANPEPVVCPSNRLRADEGMRQP